MIPGIMVMQARVVSVSATDPYWSSVSALLHFDGANGSSTITDEKGNSFTPYNGAALSTAQKKFGASSLLLNGSTQYVGSPNAAAWEFGAGDFTLEGWIRPAATITTRQEIFGRFSAYGWGLQVVDSGALRAFVANSTSGTVIVGPGSTVVSPGEWHHVALCRSGSTLRIFLDGMLQAFATISGPIESTPATLYLGVDPSTVSTRYFNGNFDEFRITKGVARYTANFTLPAEAFPNS